MAEVQIQSLSHRHREIADWLFANPSVKNLQNLANHMNLSRSWLSIVMRSDVFREYFEKRRKEYETEMHNKLHTRQLEVTLKALDRLDDILNDDEIDDRLVFDIANKTAMNLGFAPSRRRETIVDEHVQEVSRPVSAGVLADARELFRRTVRIEHDPE